MCFQATVCCNLCTITIGISERCLFTCSSPASWDEASKTCHDLGGHLAVDDDNTVHSVINQLMVNLSVKQAWIGGRSQPLYWHWTYDLNGELYLLLLG